MTSDQDMQDLHSAEPAAPKASIDTGELLAPKEAPEAGAPTGPEAAVASVANQAAEGKESVGLSLHSSSVEEAEPSASVDALNASDSSLRPDDGDSLGSNDARPAVATAPGSIHPAETREEQEDANEPQVSHASEQLESVAIHPGCPSEGLLQDAASEPLVPGAPDAHEQTSHMTAHPAGVAVSSSQSDAEPQPKTTAPDDNTTPEPAHVATQEERPVAPGTPDAIQPASETESGALLDVPANNVAQTSRDIPVEHLASQSSASSTHMLSDAGSEKTREAGAPAPTSISSPGADVMPDVESVVPVPAVEDHPPGTLLEDASESVDAGECGTAAIEPQSEALPASSSVGAQGARQPEEEAALSAVNASNVKAGQAATSQGADMASQAPVQAQESQAPSLSHQPSGQAPIESDNGAQSVSPDRIDPVASELEGATAGSREEERSSMSNDKPAAGTKGATPGSRPETSQPHAASGAPTPYGPRATSPGASDLPGQHPSHSRSVPAPPTAPSRVIQGYAPGSRIQQYSGGSPSKYAARNDGSTIPIPSGHQPDTPKYDWSSLRVEKPETKEHKQKVSDLTRLTEQAQAKNTGKPREENKPAQADAMSSTQVPVAQAGSSGDGARQMENRTPAAQVKEPCQATRPPEPLSDAEVLKKTSSLWKYHPVPEGPDKSPEYRAYREEYDASTVTTARVRGKKHKHDGTNCDDWYDTGSFGDVTFIAVSDGAGSKAYSRVGAKASCEAAVGYLKAAFEQMNPAVRAALRLDPSDPQVNAAYAQLADVLQKSVLKAYDAVELDYIRRRGRPLYESELGRGLDVRDLSATLLVAVVVPVGADGTERLVMSCQIGDGMICALNTKKPYQEAFKLMGVADAGEYSGETDFLTSPATRTPEALSRRTMLHRGTFDHVLVMTDGVADDYDSRQQGIARLYLDLVANGILDAATCRKGAQPDVLADFARKLPDPLTYPWVNDPRVEIPLHSVDRICEHVEGVTLEELWNNPWLLAACRASGPMRDNDRSARLQYWLDNYVQRGSFDDRTLVIASIKEKRP